MAYVVGIDEAGYGPNLGPLVISATVWQVHDGVGPIDLYKLLAKVIIAQIPTSTRTARQRLTIADSKVLYSPETGIGLLERGVLAALALMGHEPRCWSELWPLVCHDSATFFAAEPWFNGYEASVPLAACHDDLQQLVPRVRQGCDAAGVRLMAIRSRAIFPTEWNRALERDNKATALSTFSLGLLADVLNSLPDGPVGVVCDKHGGRNSYQCLLQRQIVDWVVEVHGESAAVSRYRWGPAHRRVEATFCPEGERWLSVALASMTSKYLRELAMRAFNEFWCRHVPELRPTAGYPLDARRFKQEIHAAQTALGIDDCVLWRLK